MVRVYELKYKGKKSGTNTTILNYTLYGRLLYRKYRGKTYANYVPGMLHNTKYSKNGYGKLFINDINDIDFDLLSIFCTFSYEEVDIPQEKLNMITAEEFWMNKAKERNVTVRKQKCR